MSRLKPLESRWGSRWVLMRELMSLSFAASSGCRKPRDFCRIITAESDTVSKSRATCSRVRVNWDIFEAALDCQGMQSRFGPFSPTLERCGRGLPPSAIRTYTSPMHHSLGSLSPKFVTLDTRCDIAHIDCDDSALSYSG